MEVTQSDFERDCMDAAMIAENLIYDGWKDNDTTKTRIGATLLYTIFMADAATDDIMESQAFIFCERAGLNSPCEHPKLDEYMDFKKSALHRVRAIDMSTETLEDDKLEAMKAVMKQICKLRNMKPKDKDDDDD